MKKIIVVLFVLLSGFSLPADSFDPLTSAIGDGNFNTFTRLMRSRFSVGERDEWGWMPIHYAASMDKSDDSRFLGYLYGHGADIEARIITTDHAEREYGDYSYAWEDFTPLMVAADGGNLTSVRFMVEHCGARRGDTIGEKTALDVSIFEGKTEVVKYLHSLETNKTGSRYFPYLNMAISYEHPDIALYLIEAGADINVECEDFSALQQTLLDNSYNPLLFKTLLDRGADIYRTDPIGGSTALHFAATVSPNATRILMERGMDINRPGWDRNTPLMAAVLHGNIYSAQMLMDAGADTTPVNQYGKTALDIAREKGFDTVAEVLQGRLHVKMPDFPIEDEIETGIYFTSQMKEDIELTRLAGGRDTIRHYRGKVIFFNIWASWCPPCATEMPSMQKVYDRLRGRNFEIMAVATDESAEDVQRFLDSGHFTFSVFHDPYTSETGSAEYYRGLPTTLIIDKYGSIVYSTSGGRDWTRKKYFDFIEQFVD